MNSMINEAFFLTVYVNKTEAIITYNTFKGEEINNP